MWPTIHHGDLVIIDKKHKCCSKTRADLFLMVYAGVASVRRVTRGNLWKAVLLSSCDNRDKQTYRDLIIPCTEKGVQEEVFSLIGQVVCIIHMLPRTEMPF